MTCARLGSAQGPIVLDPGHGGEDLGAVVGGKREKDLALIIAQKLQSRLGLGARLTRDTDTYIPLDRRIDQSIAWEGSAFVSLHLNQVRHKRARGITVYAYGRSYDKDSRRRRLNLPPLPAPPRQQIRESSALAASVVKSLRKEGFRVDPLARAEYYVLKNPKIPSILIELGYLSNPEESARLNDPAYQDKLVSALADSLRATLAKLPAVQAPILTASRQSYAIKR